MSFPPRQRSSPKAFNQIALALLALAAGSNPISFNARGQEVIFRETFETEGEGTRYTTEGSAVYEPARIASELNRNDQLGPVYWARKSKVSFVGIPEATPARRALLCWHHSIPSASVTPEFLSLFDSVVKWLVKNKANATVLFSPPPTGPGDNVLTERLKATGYRVVDDDGAVLPAQPTMDLVIASSSGSAGEGPSRFARYPVPLLTYNAPNHDDELLSTTGQPAQLLNIGDVTVAAPNHPAVGGKTGLFKVVIGEAPFDTIGRLLPEGATVLATFHRPQASEPGVTEKVPFVVVIEEGAAGGKAYGGGPLAGFEGSDFFAGAGLNKFAASVTPKTLTLKPVDVSGRKSLKLTISVAASFVDFETADFLDVFVDPDAEGPAGFDRLIGFAAPSDNDKFLDDTSTNPDRPLQLGLRFQDVTYELPANATQVVIRIEALNNWWNETVGFDNIRITAGDLILKPVVSIGREGTNSAIKFTGLLQSATSLTGPWTDVADAKSPYPIAGGVGSRFFRARSP